MPYIKGRRQLVIAYADGLAQCPHCTYWYAPNRAQPEQRYCSKNCQIEAHRQAKRQEEKP